MRKPHVVSAANSSILSTFKVSGEAYERAAASGVQKFIEAIDKQIEYAQMEKEGKELPMQGSEQRQLSPRLMYWEKNGTWFITVRYGTSLLDMTGNKSLLSVKSLSEYRDKAKATLEIGKDLDSVLRTFEAIKKAATETKELEPFINHLSSLMAERLQGRAGRKGGRSRR